MGRIPPKKPVETSEDDDDAKKTRVNKKNLDAIREEDEILNNNNESARRRKEYAQQLRKPTPKVHKPKPPMPYEPKAELRNFNEIDCLGLLERDQKGNIVVSQNEHGEYVDLNQRKVTQHGHLLDKDEDIVSAHDPNFKMFTNVLGGGLPAPFSFERYNFSAF